MNRISGLFIAATTAVGLSGCGTIPEKTNVTNTVTPLNIKTTYVAAVDNPEVKIDRCVSNGINIIPVAGSYVILKPNQELLRFRDNNFIMDLPSSVNETSSFIGEVVGSVFGAAVGAQFGGGNGKIAATVVGAAIGGAAGTQISNVIENSRQNHRVDQLSGKAACISDLTTLYGPIINTGPVHVSPNTPTPYTVRRHRAPSFCRYSPNCY